SGAILFHMSTAVAAEWIRVPERMNAFLAGMGGTSVFKPWPFSVFVEFVPVTFDPELEGALEGVEYANGIERGQLVSARYVKPIHRRHPGQRSAHAIFGFASPGAANHAI
ncbi:hypothetical protein C8R44DRAFT_549119, partial [Mycena epipterygia]